MIATSKRCKACGDEKPLADFYRDKTMADGYRSKCKSCFNEQSEQARQQRTKAGHERERKRQYRRANPEIHRGDNARRKPEAIARDIKKYHAANREKLHAHAAVGRALRRGDLKRKPCEQCGSTRRVEAHHEDYSRPLDVTWLCPFCHGEQHWV